MLTTLLKIARVIVGVALVIVGLLALVTPLTPGAWLAVIGLEMLGWRFAYGKYAARAKSWILEKWRACRRHP